MALIATAAPAGAMTPETAAPLGPQPSRTDQTDPDIIALSNIWLQMADTWARGDGRTYSLLYTEDADLVNIKGEHIKTRNGIAKQIQYYFDNDLKNTRLLRLEERIRFLSPTMAIIVRRDCVLYGAETACRPDTLSLNTSVAVKTSGRWLLTSFHNTLVQQEEDQRPAFSRSSTNEQVSRARDVRARAKLTAGVTLRSTADCRMTGMDDVDPDIAALGILWQQQANAWAKGDGKAYGATYTPDADFVNVTGDHMRTRDQIATNFQRYFGDQLKNTRIHTLEEKIHLLTPSLAMIIRKGCVFYGAETTCHPNTLSVNTSILVKTAGRWLVRSFHNTLVKQPAASPGSAASVIKNKARP